MGFGLVLLFSLFFHNSQLVQSTQSNESKRVLLVQSTVAPPTIPEVIQTVDVSKHYDPVAFKLNKETWFEVSLPSLEVDFFLQFNSSVDDKGPCFDVRGSFCKHERTELLFPRIKGPVSKMISRIDLSSLKSRTKCNGTKEDVKGHKVYLITKPLTFSTIYRGSFVALLLKNTTVQENETVTKQIISPTKLPIKLLSTVNVNQASTRVSTPLPSSRPVQSSTVIPLQQSSNQPSLERRKREAAGQSSVTLDDKQSKKEVVKPKDYALDVILNDEDDQKVNVKVINDGVNGENCTGHIQLTTKECKGELKAFTGLEFTVTLSDYIKCDQKITHLHISGSVECAGDEKNIKVEVATISHSNGNLLYLWIPLAALLVLVILIIIGFIIYQRRRAVQRCEFQRQTALSRTLTDPRPRPFGQSVQNQNPTTSEGTP